LALPQPVQSLDSRARISEYVVIVKLVFQQGRFPLAPDLAFLGQRNQAELRFLQQWNDVFHRQLHQRMRSECFF